MSDLQQRVDRIAEMLSNPFDPEDFEWDQERIEAEGAPSAFDYLTGVFDTEYVFESDGETPKSGIILVASGGPNIWVDFRWNEVRGFWYGETARASFEDKNDVEYALITLAEI